MQDPERPRNAEIRRDTGCRYCQLAGEIPDTLMSEGEKYFHVYQKMIMTPFPKDDKKHSSCCFWGPHPSVSWSATVSFIMQGEGTHLAYRREHKQPSWRQNTPTDISTMVIFSHSSHIQLSWSLLLGWDLVSAGWQGCSLMQRSLPF